MPEDKIRLHAVWNKRSGDYSLYLLAKLNYIERFKGSSPLKEPLRFL